MAYPNIEKLAEEAARITARMREIKMGREGSQKAVHDALHADPPDARQTPGSYGEKRKVPNTGKKDPLPATTLIMDSPTQPMEPTYKLFGPLLAEISPGEYLDRLSILEVRESMSGDFLRREAARDNLCRFQDSAGPQGEQILRHALSDVRLHNFVTWLRQVNRSLWSLEDEIRQAAKSPEVSRARVADLALRIVHANDERSTIKARINALYNLGQAETKIYAPGGEEAA